MGSEASSWLWVPTAWMRPSSSTTILSVFITEVTRWAMMILVTPVRAARALRILASVAVSTALTESSKIRTLGFFSRVRAMHSRCFCPPDTLTPPWPRSASRPPGIRCRNSSAQAARQAAHSSSSLAPGLPQSRFSRTVPENRTFFCSTMPTASRRAVRSYSRTSRPPTSTRPSVASYSRGISWTRVDLADPVPPRMPTVSPGWMTRSMPARAYSAASGWYLKETCSKATPPSGISVTGWAGFASSTCSSSTAAMRWALASERVISRNTLEIIISEFITCST